MPDEVPGDRSEEPSGREDAEVEGAIERTRMDEVVEALAHRTRRLVLYYLRDAETTTVEHLAGHVVAHEGAAPAGGAFDEWRERAKTELYHNHLPRLTDAGLIEYDRQSGTVRYAEQRPFLGSILGLLAQLERVTVE